MRKKAFISRILFIAPEVIFFPCADRGQSGVFLSRRGKKTEFFADLLSGLIDLGLDVHIAQPEYRQLFSRFSRVKSNSGGSRIPAERLHFARDRAFYYADDIDVNTAGDNTRLSLAFQREVIHHLIPAIQPDIIHCYDWMTGLIPAMAKSWSIPCLFTIYDIRSNKIPLWLVEEMGIDAADFWKNLYFQWMPADFEEARNINPVDLLMTGILAADHVNSASAGFSAEIRNCRSRNGTSALSRLLREKSARGCVSAACSRDSAASEHLSIYRELLAGPPVTCSN